MNFSKNSWHYKLNYKIYDSFYGQHQSLCIYFWKTIGAISLVTLTGSGIIILTIGLIYLLAYPLTQIWIGTEIGIAIPSVIVWGIIAKIIQEHQKEITEMFPKLDKILIKKKEKAYKSKPPKEPSLLLSFLKAKKDKVCPLIEFIED